MQCLSGSSTASPPPRQLVKVPSPKVMPGRTLVVRRLEGAQRLLDGGVVNSRVDLTCHVPAIRSF